MLTMQGKIVELWRFKVTTTEGIEHFSTQKQVDSFCSKKDCRVDVLDTTEREWINGLAFDSRKEALEALAKGESAYRLEQDQKDLAKIRAHLDFVSIMIGVDL